MREMYRLDCWSEAEIKNSIFPRVNGKSLLRRKEIDTAPRPFVDEVILVSDKGEKISVTRSNHVLVWLGERCPYAQWHYPFWKWRRSSKANSHPARISIAEGVGSDARVVFLRLACNSVMLFEWRSPSKTVIANGLVLDKNGNKCPSGLGNAVDPQDNRNMAQTRYVGTCSAMPILGKQPKIQSGRMWLKCSERLLWGPQNNL